MNKITVEQLIDKATQSDRDKLKFKEVDSAVLGGKLVIKKIPLVEVISLVDGLNENPGASEALEMEKELIYKCCPILNNKELQDAYECVEPYDIVLHVFDENMGEINRISEIILGMYGLSDNIDNIKN